MFVLQPKPKRVGSKATRSHVLLLLSSLLHVDGKKFFELLNVVDERRRKSRFVQQFSRTI